MHRDMSRSACPGRFPWPRACAWMVMAILLASCRSGPGSALAGPEVGSAVSDPLAREYPLRELQEDFMELRGYIDNVHPKLYADREAIAALLETNYLLLSDGMTELELLRLLAPVVSLLNCGHSSLSLSPESQDRLSGEDRLFPLLMLFADGRAWVTGNGLHPEIPTGSGILSINGLAMEDIVARLFGSLGADGRNLTRKYAMLNGWFRFFYRDFVDASGGFDVVFRSGSAHAALRASLPGATDEAIERANPDHASARRWFHETPYEADFRSGLAILTMRFFQPDGGHSLSDHKAFIDGFFARVVAEGVGTVILDVRDNSGGDPYVTSHLLGYLAAVSRPYFAESAPNFYPGLKRPVPLAADRFGGRLLVLMNGGSFSSTGHLLALLRSQGVGTFVGEESGGSFACSDGSITLSLRHTGLRFRCSTMVWEVAAAGLEPGRGIMPDHPVRQTVEDALSGRDTVLEYAMGLALQP